MSLILPFHRQSCQPARHQTKNHIVLMHVSAQVCCRVLFPSHVFNIDAQEDGGLSQAERIYGETLFFLHSLKD